jgi:hypothetical protein
MQATTRFQDENLLLSDFYSKVMVECPACRKKAYASADFETGRVRLSCLACGHNKEVTSRLNRNTTIEKPAHEFFDAMLWLQAPFKENVFWTYNYKHLDYLEQYISADLREHKDRNYFTLLEKLPKFYHQAKNREALLKIISKLRTK